MISALLLFFKAKKARGQKELLEDFIKDLSNPMALWAPVPESSLKYLPREFVEVAFPQYAQKVL
ncbi:hypothetical protein [Thermofilum pendens]|uniref:hypothetical protein n=1 Tax=Thermofilum pendens TaxID=2269 RepID=UPI00032166FB|nr:hypothetical protein [Thermofilum pendens]